MVPHMLAVYVTNSCTLVEPYSFWWWAWSCWMPQMAFMPPIFLAGGAAWLVRRFSK